MTCSTSTGGLIMTNYGLLLLYVIGCIGGVFLDLAIGQG